jgi:prepilin-type N-terminal cleavage/methylation domain-containing protein
MRTERGFTLVELLVVMSIITIFCAIATVQWNRLMIKNGIETQIKTVHADLMGIRLEALYGKRERSVIVSGKLFKIYSSTVTTVTPLRTTSFKYNFINADGSASATITFDTSGMANGTQTSLCVDPYGDPTQAIDAAVDSVVVSQARINLGKRDEGGGCDQNGIKQR